MPISLNNPNRKDRLALMKQLHALSTEIHLLRMEYTALQLEKLVFLGDVLLQRHTEEPAALIPLVNEKVTALWQRSQDIVCQLEKCAQQRAALTEQLDALDY